MSIIFCKFTNTNEHCTPTSTAFNEANIPSHRSKYWLEFSIFLWPGYCCSVLLHTILFIYLVLCEIWPHFVCISMINIYVSQCALIKYFSDTSRHFKLKYLYLSLVYNKRKVSSPGFWSTKIQVRMKNE